MVATNSGTAVFRISRNFRNSDAVNDRMGIEPEPGQ
jgi:hypothetical protein